MGGQFETYRGVVLDNADPGGYQRVQVRVPDITAEPLTWTMSEQPGAVLPAVGDQVWVRFENGDPEVQMWSA